MKVDWKDIGNSEVPGEYHIHGQIVLVQRSDIQTWKNHPGAVFDALDARFKDGGVGHILDERSETE